MDQGIQEWIDWNGKNNTGKTYGSYGMTKRIAEKKNRWKLIAVNRCDYGDDI